MATPLLEGLDGTPIGLLWWMRKPDTAGKDTTTLARNGAAIMLVMWFVFAFSLFSFMGTKFHHYIFPAVPPIAMLIGIVLDDMLGRTDTTSPRFTLAGVGLAGGLTAAVVALTAKLGGSFWGDKGASFTSTDKLVLAIGVALVPVAWLVAKRFEKPAFVPLPEGAGAPEAPTATEPGTPVASPYRGGSALGKDELEGAERERIQTHEALMLGGAAVAGALVLLLVGRDLDAKGESADQPGAIRLLHLFTYNYRRPWPDTLDFGAILSAIAIVGAVVMVVLAVRRLRRWAVLGMCSLAFVAALWGLDVYMVRTAPHWGQHEITEAYYAARTGPDEPLVAYQMNWKGENFYTGNHIPAFVSSGSTFTQWVKQQKEKGTKVMFFVTEHTRTGGLRSEVGARSYKEITDKALCNKFVLVRAEL